VRRLRKVAVIGVGLIGGSLALALRRAGFAGPVAGFDRDRGALERAVALHAIDEIAESVSEATRGAELVVVAVPVRAIGSVLHDVGLALDAKAVVTDVGSTKAEVVEIARHELRERFPRFVPGHPIAGRESSGIEAATLDLFKGARVVLTPVAETELKATDFVRAAWEAAGARVSTLSAVDHDRIFAAVSHLPHFLSFALVSEIASRPDSADLFSFAAGGFRDFTRIAAGDPAMWRDVLLANREQVLQQSQAFRAALSQLEASMSAGDSQALEDAIAAASAARARWQPGAGLSLD